MNFTAKPQMILVLALGTALAGPLWAESLFTIPSACEGFLTVQLKTCQVGNYYRCAGDAPGDINVTYSDAGGPFYTSRIDSETRWMESFNHEDGTSEALDTDAEDHASFSALINEGRDDFDFSTTSNYGETRFFRGYDRLTGKTVLLDGVTLEQTEFELSTYDAAGDLLHIRKGQQFINREWRLFFSGVESFENTFGDKAERDDTPVDFVFPDQPGFFAASPKYGCEQMMTDLAPQPSITPVKLVTP